MQDSLFKDDASKLATLRPGQHLFSMLEKYGERNALRAAYEAGDESHVPIVVFPGHKIKKPKKNEQPKPPKPITRDWLRARAKYVRWAVEDRVVFIDAFGIDLSKKIPRALKKTDPQSVIFELYDACRCQKLKFVPVIDLSKPTAYRKAIKDCLTRDCRGVAFRLRVSRTFFSRGRSAEEILKAELEELEVESRCVDLFLDLGYIHRDTDLSAKSIAKIIDAAKSIGSWRSVALLGSSIPETMTDVDKGQVDDFERKEYTAWRELVEMGYKDLVFGDYGIQNPVPPIEEGGLGYPNVRYTVGDVTLVSRGFEQQKQVDDVAQYRECCERLKGRPQWKDEDTSPADEEIEECAEGGKTPTDPRQWRRIGTRRHLHVTRDQVKLQ